MTLRNYAARGVVALSIAMEDIMADFTHTDPVTGLRDDPTRYRGPMFAPLDVIAFVMIVLMIWGPLAAGALRQ